MSGEVLQSQKKGGLLLLLLICSASLEFAQCLEIFPTYQTARTVGGQSITENTLTIRFSSQDGEPGVDGNTRVFSGTTSIGSGKNLRRVNFQGVTGSPSTLMTKQLLANAPTHHKVVSRPVWTPLITPLEQSANTYDMARVITQTAQRLLTNSTVLLRRLLDTLPSVSEYERDYVDLSWTKNADVEAVLTKNTSVIAGVTENKIAEIQKYGRLMSKSLNLTAAVLDSLVDSVQQSVDGLNLTRVTIETANETLLQITRTVNDLNRSIFGLDEQKQNVISATETAFANIKQAENDVLLEIATLPAGNTSSAFQLAANLTLDSMRTVLDSWSDIRTDYELLLGQVSIFNKAMENARLDLGMERKIPQVHHDTVQEIESRGMYAWVSDLFPAVVPTYTVADDITGANDAGAFFSVRYIWNSYTDDYTSTFDDDLGLDSLGQPQTLGGLTGQQAASWATIRPLSNNNSFLFTHMTKIGVACDNTHLLLDRGNWFVKSDIVNKIDGTPCTPNLDCKCWVKVDRERCIANGQGFTSSVPTLSIIEDAGLCNGAIITDSPGSFYYVDQVQDRSITGLPASELLLSTAALNAELRKICKYRTRIGPHRIYSTLTTLDANSTGELLSLFTNTSFCSTNFDDMTREQNVAHIFYTYLEAAVMELYKKVSSKWERDFSGTTDIATGRQTVPIHTFGAYKPGDQLLQEFNDYVNGVSTNVPDPPPFQIRTEIVSNLAVGQEMGPVYLLCPIRQPQYLNITFQMPNGSTLVTNTIIDNYNEFQENSDKCFIWFYYMDCAFDMECPNPLGGQARQFASYVYDLPDGTSVHRDSILRRWQALYLMKFAPVFDNMSQALDPDIEEPTRAYAPLYINIDPETDAPMDNQRYNPKTAPYYTSTHWGVDKWLQENRQQIFDPDNVGESPHEFKRYTKFDNDTGLGIVCDEESVQVGGGVENSVCLFLRRWRLAFGNVFDPSLPELDISPTIRAYLKVWSATATVVIPGELTEDIVAEQSSCPSPGSIRVKLNPSANAVLSVANSLSNSPINVTVETDCTTISISRSSQRMISPQATAEFILPNECQQQITRVKVTETSFSTSYTCWEQEYNLNQTQSKTAPYQANTTTATDVGNIMSETGAKARAVMVAAQNLHLEAQKIKLQAALDVRRIRSNYTVLTQQASSLMEVVMKDANDKIKTIQTKIALIGGSGMPDFTTLRLDVTSNQSLLQQFSNLAASLTARLKSFNDVAAITNITLDNNTLAEIELASIRGRNISAGLRQLAVIANATTPPIEIVDNQAYVNNEAANFNASYFTSVKNVKNGLFSRIRTIVGKTVKLATDVYTFVKGVINYIAGCVQKVVKGDKKGVEQCVCNSPAAVACSLGRALLYWLVVAGLVAIGLIVVGVAIYLIVKFTSKNK